MILQMWRNNIRKKKDELEISWASSQNSLLYDRSVFT